MLHRGSPVYLDITTTSGLLYLHVQFISQSSPDIRLKLRQLDKDPEIPQRDVLKIAFKMFNNREEEAKREKDHEKKAKYALLAAAIKGRDQPSPSHPRLRLKTPPRPCSQCNQSGHWAKACLNPWPPTKSCPTCGQWGHSKMYCPQGCPSTPGEVPTSKTWKVECPQGLPGAPGEILTSPQNPSPTPRELFQ